MFKKKPKKRWMLILIVVFIVVLWNGYQRQELAAPLDTYSDSSKFDSSKWINVADSAYHERQYMTKDLLDHYLNTSMDTEAVKNILGIPDARAYKPQRYYYALGHYKDHKPLFLVITWNEKGKIFRTSTEEY
jgi:hypothetical protein